MSNGRKRGKLSLVRQHRKVWYERSLDLLKDGKVYPADVTYRWQLYKGVKGK